MKPIRYHFDNLAEHGIDWDEVLGRTSDGRYLQLVFAEQTDHLWVFHGRNMNATERRRYHRK